MDKKQITILAPCPLSSVRLVKISEYLKQKNYELTLLGWNRHKGQPYTSDVYDKIEVVFTGGGEGRKMLPLFYLLFILKLFCKLLFRRNNTLYFAVNFETAYPAWLASRFRKINYAYDIWDELAISHNFPSIIKKFIRYYDKKVRKGASFYIHVDKSRISEIDTEGKYIIIYNTPVDYYKGSIPEIEYTNSFAVTGWLNKTRGLDSIYNFAVANPSIKFIVIGEFLQKENEEKYCQLPNVDFHHFMPQSELFGLIKACRGIFSLYDPSIEINRLAASNKLYDAMMMAIPVVVNEGILASKFVNETGIGYVVNYNYDKSWEKLAEFNLQEIKLIGNKGRDLYLGRYEFNTILDDTLLPAIERVIQ